MLHITTATDTNHTAAILCLGKATYTTAPVFRNLTTSVFVRCDVAVCRSCTGRTYLDVRIILKLCVIAECELNVTAVIGPKILQRHDQSLDTKRANKVTFCVHTDTILQGSSCGTADTVSSGAVKCTTSLLSNLSFSVKNYLIKI